MPKILVYRSKEGATGMKLLESHKITFDNLPRENENFTTNGMLYKCDGITRDYDNDQIVIFAMELRQTKKGS